MSKRSKRKTRHSLPEQVETPAPTAAPKKRLDFASLAVFGSVIVFAIAFFGAQEWWGSRATGTIDICRSEDRASSSAIMLTVAEGWGRSHSYSKRSLFAFDAATGKQGKSFDPGARSQCLGGLGPNVVVDTAKNGIHVRSTRDGSIVVTESALLGDLATSRQSWSYDPPSHRLRIKTKFNDDFTVDLTTHERWVTSKAPPARPPPAVDDLVRLELEIEYDTRAGIARGSSYTLAYDGSRCKLATRAMNAYGNTIGVNSDITPVPGADELLVASIIRFLPGEEGLLVSALARLDESSRQLVRLGFDGKVRWTAPIATTFVDGFVAGDALLLGALHLPASPGLYPKDPLTVWLVGKDDGRVRSVLNFPARDAISGDVADVVQRFGDTLVVASHGEAAALPIEGGKPRWKGRF